MPDGKPDIDDELEDDPFEGLELGDDAPEPTQEEMDEWATLDIPDEDSSLTMGARTGNPVEPVARSASALVPEVPKSAENKKNEEVTDKDVSKEEQYAKPKDSAFIAATNTATPAEAEARPETLPPATEQQEENTIAGAQLSVSNNPPRVAEVPEITPAASPTAPKRTADQHSYVDNDGDEQYGDEEDEGTSLLLQQRQQQQRQGGWGVSWGVSWGLGALGGKLREVAAGAVRDVKDLTETFQAALADVTGAEDEVEQARRISAMDRAAEAEAAGGVEEPDEEAEGAVGPALPTDPPRQAAEPAREGTLQARGSGTRGDGAGGVRGSAGGSLEPLSPPADPALEAGLQTIDAQVGHLATGAARAFSSLWGGLSSVAKVVAAEVVASVADVQSSETVRGVAQIGTKLAHTAERGLETVGRTAMVLLEEVAGVGHAGRRRIWGEEADARAADMGREPSSFQDFFYIYGGEQLAEEVNNLSNECAHLCNKSRSRLEGDQQQALDDALARLGPYFNDPWVGAKVSEPVSGEEAAASDAGSVIPELDDSSKEAAERLGQMYDPIGYLCQDSLLRSEAFMHQLVEAVAAAHASEAAAAVGGSRPRRGRQQSGDGDKGEEDEPGDEAEAEHEEEEEEEPAALLRKRAEPRLLLDSFRAHFTKRLAEVTTAQLQLMLNLGASLAAPARTGRPAVDGIAWPESSEQQAALLAMEARRMVADLQTVTAAYAATLEALCSPATRAAAVSASTEGGSPEDAAPEPPAREDKVLDELAAMLAANSQSASDTIRSGYKGLLYAVLLRSLVTRIAQQQEQQDLEAATEGGNPSEATEASSAAQQ